MNRIVTLALALSLAACVTAPQKTTWAEAGYAPAPVRELHRMEITAFPPLVLKPMILGRTIDSWLGGNYGSSTYILCNEGGTIVFDTAANCTNGNVPASPPTLAGQVMCATGSAASAWESPATCGLATGTNYWTLVSNVLTASSGWGLQLLAPSAGNNGAYVWAGYPDNTGANYIGYQFDVNSGLISRFGKQVQQYAYHGLDIDIGEAGTIPGNPTLNEGFTLTLHNTGSSIALKAGTGTTSIALTPGANGVTISSPSTAGIGGITWMGSCSATVTTTTVPANSCVSVLLSSGCTGAAVASSCHMGDSNTSGATSTAIQSTCYVSAANTVQIHACNVTTSSASLSGTFKARVMNY